MQDEALIVFLRAPTLGKVKTRIALTTGDELALKIYKNLLTYTFNSVSQLPMPVSLFYEGELPLVLERDPRFAYHLQIEGTLDQKMAHAFSRLLEKFHKVIIIGSDCPMLTPSIIQEGFKKLASNDIVVGPAKDGGFYLFGCRELPPKLFENIYWGTSSVLKQLLFNIEKASLSYHLLEALADVDTEEDWKAFTYKMDPPVSG